MRKLPVFAVAGVAAAAIAGTAIAANRNSHVMNVPLPDGSTVRVQYVGDVAPKVMVDPVRPVSPDDWSVFPSFAGFDRMMEQMSRETEAMIHQAQEMATRPGVGAAPFVASFGNAPAGASSSTTIVSFSNGSGTCTRTTQAVSQGPGKPPKVTTSVSGNCGADSGPVQPAPSSAPINHT